MVLAPADFVMAWMARGSRVALLPLFQRRLSPPSAVYPLPDVVGDDTIPIKESRTRHVLVSPSQASNLIPPSR